VKASNIACGSAWITSDESKWREAQKSLGVKSGDLGRAGGKVMLFSVKYSLVKKKVYETVHFDATISCFVTKVLSEVFAIFT
jgi:hypothetical protein